MPPKAKATLLHEELTALKAQRAALKKEAAEKTKATKKLQQRRKRLLKARQRLLFHLQRKPNGPRSCAKLVPYTARQQSSSAGQTLSYSPSSPKWRSESCVTLFNLFLAGFSSRKCLVLLQKPWIDSAVADVDGKSGLKKTRWKLFCSF